MYVDANLLKSMPSGFRNKFYLRKKVITVIIRLQPGVNYNLPGYGKIRLK